MHVALKPGLCCSTDSWPEMVDPGSSYIRSPPSVSAPQHMPEVGGAATRQRKIGHCGELVVVVPGFVEPGFCCVGPDIRAAFEGINDCLIVSNNQEGKCRVVSDPVLVQQAEVIEFWVPPERLAHGLVFLSRRGPGDCSIMDGNSCAREHPMFQVR